MTASTTTAPDTVRIEPLRCGVLTAPADAFVAGATGDLDLQVWAFLVHHPRGTVLFDTGMHPMVRDDAAAHLGGLAGLFRIDYGADDDIAARLRGVGADPADIPIVVAGGPKEGDAASTVRAIRESIQAGAQGVVVGRKIWQRDPGEASDMIKEIAEITRTSFTRRW